MINPNKILFSIFLLIGFQNAFAADPKPTQELHPDWFHKPRLPHEDDSEFLSRRATEASQQSVLVVNETANLFTGRSGGAGNGTGIILGMDENNILILTNEHVVRRGPHYAQVIKVAFTDPDGEDEWTFAAEVKVSMRRDIAILLVPRASLKRATPQPAPLPKSPEHLRYLLQPGRRVAAYGNPLGERNVITAGILSAKPFDRATEHLLIQTDSAINPGNSGGALIDTATGYVVAVNTKKPIADVIESVGHAIPINVALEEVGSLLDGSHDKSQGYIFGRSQRIEPGILQREGTWPIVEAAYPDLLASQQKFQPSARGLQIITDINPETGLELGDVIIRVGGSYVGADERQVIRIIRGSARSKLPFEVLRGGAIVKVDVEIQDQYESVKSREQSFASIGGLIVQGPLLNEAGDYLGGQKGVLVTQIVPGSMGAGLVASGQIAELSLIFKAQVGSKIFEISSLKDIHSLADHLAKAEHKFVRLYVRNPIRTSASENGPRKVLIDTNDLPKLDAKPEIAIMVNPEIITSRNGEMDELRAELSKSILTGEEYSFEAVARNVVATCAERVARLSQEQKGG